MPETIQQTNRLAKEQSPYLQQHASNPVDWYPWGKEALEKAKEENKPILLSIGYAACHWCHVMAHESFEDEETAKLMNKYYVNIKVDREERPDLDKIYQTANFLLTQRSGGWPLTVFLTPDDLTPFFSGTYFPHQPRYHLPAFKDILISLADVYKNHGKEIKEQSNELIKILQYQIPTEKNIEINALPLQKGLQALQDDYDNANGGFDGAPKFPQTPKIEFLLRNNSSMALDTLNHMAMGGIYDQLGGGFFRYAVDAEWRIPHFEKMMYENGQLLYLYSLTAKEVIEPFPVETAYNTADWALNYMQSPEGGFYSSVDADSEGHEGKYYVWEKKEVKSLLSKEEYHLVEIYYGFNQPASFDGHWHLYVREPLESVASKLKLELSEAEKLLLSAKKKLLNARNKRVAPEIDKKNLTSWNGLIIKGMLTAGEMLREPKFVGAGLRGLDFIEKKMWSKKRLYASYKDGKAYLPGYLDDYVFLIDALLTSLQVHWNKDRLVFIIELIETLLTHFVDPQGGFFFTADDHEKILYRPKIMMDEAIPSANGVAVRVLLILGNLLGEERYLQTAEKTLQAAWPYLLKYPAEHCSLLMGLKEFLEPSKIVILRGPEKEIKPWQKDFQSLNSYVFAIPDTEKDLPGLLAAKKVKDKKCAYICEGNKCVEQ